MAFNAATEWEVRSTGDDANGGGFQVGSGGTDFSQQDAPQHTYTDLVIDGTTNTKITSVARPFSAVDVGNVINVTGGVGFTVQRIQIVSVDGANVATCDKAMGTTGSTGGQGKLGGGLAAPSQAFGLLVNGNTVWIRYGTYAITSTLVASQTTYRVQGYNTAHGDRSGNRPTITTSTNSTPIFTRNVSSAGPLVFDGLQITNTASTRSSAIANTTTAAGSVFFRNCRIAGVADVNSTGSTQPVEKLTLLNTEVTGCTNASTTIAGAMAKYITLVDCHIHGNAGSGVTVASSTILIALRSLIVDNGLDGIGVANVAGLIYVIGCTIARNAADGIQHVNGNPTRMVIESCIFWGNVGYGIRVASGVYADSHPNLVVNNAFGGNGSGATLNFTAGAGAVTLSVDPFTNVAAGDYSLNNAAGGGAACKNTGYSVANIL